MVEKIIIANSSAFYGDRFSAAREMVRGGPIDILTGDYLAELTMAILFRKRAKDSKGGYAATFLNQMEEIMGECLDKKIKVVSNAGGLNPSGMAEELKLIAEKLGLKPRIAFIEGDDLLSRLNELQESGENFLHMDKGIPLSKAKGKIVTANAYLGGWGIAEALRRGADIIVCGRAADASLVVGPAVWRFGWKQNDWDKIAGAIVAGHIIECGPQATGGNYPFFDEIPSLEHIGFPIAEMHGDGSCVITKHPGTGGAVTIGTVTSQLLYEIRGPAYISPDAVARFDSIALAQIAKDRVLVSGVRGEPATESSKVCINILAGMRNSMTVVLSGLDISRKYEIIKAALEKELGRDEGVERYNIRLARADRKDPQSNEEAWAFMHVSALSEDPERVGRKFSSKVVEIAMESVPGATFLNPPGDGTPAIVHWPALVSRKIVREVVHLDGSTWAVEQPVSEKPVTHSPAKTQSAPSPGGRSIRIPLGRIFGTRSGDKGGNANLGVWSRNKEGFAFLREFLTTAKLKELLPGLQEFGIERHEFPNLLALNFYIIGILEDGVAASTRWDPQAKTLGEYLRAKLIEVPECLLAHGAQSETRGPNHADN